MTYAPSGHFAFDKVEYPALIVAFGKSRNYITRYNRSEYTEHFACEVCESAEAAYQLLAGYAGSYHDLEIYAVPQPRQVFRVGIQEISCEYEPEPEEPL